MVAVWLALFSLKGQGRVLKVCDMGEIELLKREGDVKPDVYSDGLL